MKPNRLGSGRFSLSETEASSKASKPAKPSKAPAPRKVQRPPQAAAPVKGSARRRIRDSATQSPLQAKRSPVQGTQSAPRPVRAAPSRPVHIPQSSSFFELTEHYPDERSAERYFTHKRWPDGPVCTACKSKDVYDGHSKRKHTQWKCRDCGKQFTVMSGTIMEGTHLPLRKWLFAYHMMAGARHGLSTRYLARQLGISLKSAWHLTHRIRATMTNNDQVFSGIVESDETYIGGRRKHVGQGYRKNKIPVQVIVQRTEEPEGKGKAPPKVGQIQNIVLNPDAERVDGRTVGAKLRKHTDPEDTVLMTDESRIYTAVGQDFAEHHTVNHKREEYVREEPDGCLAHTNTAEGSIGNLKRQITGTHHSVSKKHLPRYLEEYDHKYNNRDKPDTAIAEEAIGKMEGKRVTLFKSDAGGDSLIGRKQTEKGKQGTKRGTSKHERTGKRKEAAPPSAPPVPEGEDSGNE